jgi:ornithine decarboxylase
MKNITSKSIIAYSTKCNYFIVPILKQLGSAFHVASASEIDGHSLYFYYKPSSNNFRHLDRKNVNIIADSIVQYNSIVNNMKNSKCLIRINPEINVRNHVFSSKYSGLGILSDELDKIDFNRVNGINVHLASQNTNINSWRKMARFMKNISLSIDSELKFIDIGGGFPISYGKKVPSIEKIFSVMRPFLKPIFMKHDAFLICEPGRYIAGPSAELETNVEAIKNKFVFVNTSVYSISLDTLIADIKFPMKCRGLKKHTYIIRGNSSCTLDVFGKARMPSVRVGDIIRFSQAGAYTTSLSTRFGKNICKIREVWGD